MLMKNIQAYRKTGSMSNNRLKDMQHACFMKVLYQITRSTIVEIPIGRVTPYFCEVFFSLSVFPSFLLSF